MPAPVRSMTPRGSRASFSAMPTLMSYKVLKATICAMRLAPERRRKRSTKSPARRPPAARAVSGPIRPCAENHSEMSQASVACGASPKTAPAMESRHVAQIFREYAPPNPKERSSSRRVHCVAASAMAVSCTEKKIGLP